MISPRRLAAIALIFVVTAVTWLCFGGFLHGRSHEQRYALRGEVADLWGSAQAQAAPDLRFRWPEERTVIKEVVEEGNTRKLTERVVEERSRRVAPAAARLEVDLHLDERRKGLIWFALYDVAFQGRWTYRHDLEIPGTLDLVFPFPDQEALYDGFVLRVDGVDRAEGLIPQDGQVSWSLAVHPGQEVLLEVTYRSRGADEWRYLPSPHGVGSLEDFELRMQTDFAAIDFPAGTLSPSEKREEAGGWALDWRFDRLVTGKGIGMEMPQRIQPGQIAAELSTSAPVSLLFFFAILFVLSALRGIDIHPLNYALLAAAFFAFHLLFAYTVDHLSLAAAFALASAVSILLVTSYLRLVVSARFALVEAAMAQLVYLVGFSLAHFWEGFTGLTVVALSVATLFLVMQLTGRLRWSELLARPESMPRPALR